MSTQMFVRREVGSLGPDDQTLAAYAAAVQVMQGRADSDPTSWAFQAAIHGTLASNPLPGQNQCQHATWFFVSWHRMFVFHFERIVRAAVIAAGGPTDWALPYWNPELGGAGAAIPPAFRSPTTNGQPNPLYVSERAPGINAGGGLPAAATTSQWAISRPSFQGAAEFGGGTTAVLFQHFQGPTGQLEATPHNAVHGVVGGQQGWMNDPDTAAQDPIFWLHHSNIDRLWAVWVANGHGNPTDPRWLNQQFSFFDENGQQVSMTATQVLDTAADLGYTYDQFVAPGTQPAPPPTPAPAPPPPPAQPAPTPAAARMSESIKNDPELIGALSAPLTLTGDAAQVAVEIDARAAASALTRLATTAPRILLEIHEVQAERHPGTVYGVYVNLPSGASAAEEVTAHVGNLSFFGVERARQPSGDEPAHGLSLTFDITALAQAQRAGGRWNDQAVSVTFKPLRLVAPEGEEPVGPGDGPEPPATVGSISIFYA
jgi:tyrosinase